MDECVFRNNRLVNVGPGFRIVNPYRSLGQRKAIVRDVIRKGCKKDVQISVANAPDKTIVTIRIFIGGNLYWGVGIARLKPGDARDDNHGTIIAQGRAEVHIALQLGGENA